MYGIAEIITMNTPEMIELIESGSGVQMHINRLQEEVDHIRTQAYQRAWETLIAQGVSADAMSVKEE